ncbi:MAG: rRNA pseudouridine synthase [Oscillospiraceae bacterium]|jgi:23S rRNA pseudouridine2605 synthase|nr:rRNA pseudouridine synthase [Oscillospiraceae bacterium]
MERLQKILSEYGICSRRKAEEMIAAGRVAVDGVTSKLGDKADPQWHLITVDGVALTAKRDKRVVLMLNKPRGYLSTASDDRGRKTVMDLLEARRERVYPVGRLDLNSDGMLLLTNDGELTKRLTHPSYRVAKLYRVRVRVRDAEYLATRFREPLTVKGVTYGGCDTVVLENDASAGTALLELTLREGKNREIRNMCEALGAEVMRLTRVGIGKLRLGGLHSGEARELTEREIASLFED